MRVLSGKAGGNLQLLPVAEKRGMEGKTGLAGVEPMTFVRGGIAGIGLSHGVTIRLLINAGSAPTVFDRSGPAQLEEFC
jgi:hypothetical protein